MKCPSFQVLLAFLLFMIMVLEIGKIRGKTKCSASNLPPGPWKLPVIGNLHQLAGSLPHRRLRGLAKKYGPLMHLKLGEVSAVVVSSAEFAKEVMKTHDLIFASRPHVLATRILSYDSTNIGFAPYGEYWRQLRKICTLELLSTKRVRSYRPIREEEVRNLIKSIASRAGSPINLTQEIYSLTFTITSRAAFGSCKGSIWLRSCRYFSFFGLLHLLSGMRPKLERLHKEADRIMGNIIKEHQRNTVSTKSGEGEAEEDLVDVLLKFHEHGNELEFSLTTENIKAVILDIFAGGRETSSTAVDWAIAEMIKKSKIIRETLRLHPPVPLLLPRECGEKCEIDGYEIPAKSKVIVNAWAIGRDPNYWNEPESFNPNRFLDSSIDYKGTNFEYIPFGAGRRMCPGVSFGLANVELPLALLLYHFDGNSPMG
ncbi:cytochrome P450, family 71, subfamily B, polypeptide 34 [Prunus dulcis]|uniref:Cytochrome P450, family 71, subfamily B, polypeptide 34 n=1 Tax=Prunus dulcis TaxID=3755 RepID=A0A5H2XJZ8_PRUDU|nr:cytochrome P450, family 71, subfamily B, polypeptide 34 [Prunus dulcis]